MIEKFQLRHINRTTFPTKHVLVCEDDISNQAQIAGHLAKLFGGQGMVQVSFIAGALHAAAVMDKIGVDLIILDHDMPFGNGPDLLEWMKEAGHRPPVLTFSGIAGNNTCLMEKGATHHFEKTEVMAGKADMLICQLLQIPVGLQ